jgi:hypothetical protein
MTNKNNFQAFYDTLSKDEKKALADRADTSVDYLYQLAQGYRKPGMSICSRLKAADGRITDAMLRPDLYRGAA